MRQGRCSLRLARIILLIACAAPVAAGDSALLAPTLGRPVVVSAGQSFSIAAAADSPVARASAVLVYRRDRAIRIPLTLPEDAAARIAAGAPLTATVPESTPVGTFDLELTLDGAKLMQRHAVSIWTPTRRLRIVHLSDLDFGDLSVPALDPRLVDEVNLAAPALVVLTGDLVDPGARDILTAWRSVIEYLEGIDAPLLIAQGDHDVPELYSRFIAPSPVGDLRIGDYRGIVLSDHALGSIAADPGQRDWVEKLAAVEPPAMSFVVSHADTPTLLTLWARDGRCAEMLRSLRLGVWFSGGAGDATAEDAQRLPTEAGRMIWLKTAAASGTTRDGALGVPHYRVIELEDDRILLLNGRAGESGPPSSFAVGGLRTRVDGHSDGSDSRVRVYAASARPFSMDGLAMSVRVKKTGDALPWSIGAVIEQSVDCDTYWDCRVRFSLPARGGVHFTVGADSQPPPTAISTRIDVADVVEFETDDSGRLSARRASGLVLLENRGGEPATVRVQLRLAGEPLAFRAGDAPDFVTAARLTLAAAGTLILRPDMSAIRVAPGLREMQVYVEDEYSLTPTVKAIEVRVVGSSPPATR